MSENGWEFVLRNSRPSTALNETFLSREPPSQLHCRRNGRLALVDPDHIRFWPQGGIEATENTVLATDVQNRLGRCQMLADEPSSELPPYVRYIVLTDI